MSVFSITHAGRVRVWSGKISDFQNDLRIWGVNDLLVPTDAPDTVYKGDKVNTFLKLSPIGKVKRPQATAINTTAAGTALVILAAIAAGLITSTSAAAVNLTLPTAVQLAAQFGGVRGVSLDFVVDNSLGANTVTVVVSTGVTVSTAVLTGSDSLAVASGKVGIFRLYFVSATAVLISRVS